MGKKKCQNQRECNVFSGTGLHPKSTQNNDLKIREQVVCVYVRDDNTCGCATSCYYQQVV